MRWEQDVVVNFHYRDPNLYRQYLRNHIIESARQYIAIHVKRTGYIKRVSS